MYTLKSSNGNTLSDLSLEDARKELDNNVRALCRYNGWNSKTVNRDFVKLSHPRYGSQSFYIVDGQNVVQTGEPL